MATLEQKGERIKLALTILKENGGEMHHRELIDAMGDNLRLSEDELSTYDGGGVKWKVQLRYSSIGWAKAGFIRKRKGIWYLTPEGEEISSRPAEEIRKTVKERYREWKNRRDEDQPADVETEAPDDEDDTALVFETAEDRSLTEIRDHIRALGPYEMQDLVAALLRGMGYVTPFIAPKGPDGGTDVLAMPDALGVKTPHVRVQVKHRQDQKCSGPEIDSLQGNINPLRETGLFVSTSGFSPPAKQKVRMGQAHIELIDLDRFIELWIENYPNLSEEDRGFLRLRPVYFLAPD